MIGKDEIANAISEADSRVEQSGGFSAYWQDQDVNLKDLTYVAMQRGLRMVMIERGENPAELSEPTAVSLTFPEQRRQMAYATVFMDGFAAALNLKGREES